MIKIFTEFHSVSSGLTEMLILSLELVKNRMGAMHGDLRRIFLSTFTTLIEKSPVSIFFSNEAKSFFDSNSCNNSAKGLFVLCGVT